MPHYHILGDDNRGTDRCIFGRVYLATKRKGECVGSIGFGQHRDDADPYAVWPTNDTPTLGHDPSLRDRAKAYLRKMYPSATKDEL